MSTRYSVVVALLAAVSLSAAACGAESAEVSSSAQTPGGGPGAAVCPDPVAAADQVSLMLPTYDYQGTATPAQLAEHVDLVVVGEVAEAGTTTNELWLELRDVSRVVGTHLAEPEMRVTVDQVGTGGLEPGVLEGLQVMAFLLEDGHEGMQVALEGLWFSCDVDDPAAPVKLEPAGEGWPITPTITGLMDLLVDPPQLVDGPVVRRSGMRDIEAIGIFIPEQLDRPTGVLALDDGCLTLLVEDSRTPMIWPPGTTWSQDELAVHLADGTSVMSGESLSPEGMHLPATTVQYAVGDQAQQALDNCAAVAADSEAPVLVIKSL